MALINRVESIFLRLRYKTCTENVTRALFLEIRGGGDKRRVTEVVCEGIHKVHVREMERKLWSLFGLKLPKDAEKVLAIRVDNVDHTMAIERIIRIIRKGT